MDTKKKISGISSKYNSDLRVTYSKIHQPMSMNHLERMVFTKFILKLLKFANKKLKIY
jgi:hypothetical protein